MAVPVSPCPKILLLEEDTIHSTSFNSFSKSYLEKGICIFLLVNESVMLSK